jgi:hypothetical protein
MKVVKRKARCGHMTTIVYEEGYPIRIPEFCVGCIPPLSPREVERYRRNQRKFLGIFG